MSIPAHLIPSLSTTKRIDHRAGVSLPPAPFALATDRDDTRPYDRRAALGPITDARMPTEPKARVRALKRLLREEMQ